MKDIPGESSSVFFGDENLTGLIFEHLEVRDCVNFSFSFKIARKAAKEDYVMKLIHKKIEEEILDCFDFVDDFFPNIDFFRRYISSGKTRGLVLDGITIGCLNGAIQIFFDEGIFSRGKDGNLLCVGEDLPLCLCRVDKDVFQTFRKNNVVLKCECEIEHNEDTFRHTTKLLYDFYLKNNL